MDKLRPDIQNVLATEQMVVKSASATLKPYERYVRVDTAAVDITLPPPAEVGPGAIFTIAVVGSITDTDVIADGAAFYKAAGYATAKYTIAVANGYLVLISDGVNWIELSSDLS